MQSFLFVTKDITYHESVGLRRKTAILSATLLELDKVSINGRLYRFEEASSIAQSMINKPVYFDVDWKGKHQLDEAPIGKIVDTKVVGKKIKGIIKITAPTIIEKLKQGLKFLFSVGGRAKTQRFVGGINKSGKLVRKLIGAVIEHLQMIPDGKNIFGQSKVGFPSARLEKVLKIEESVLHVAKGLALLVALGVI